MSPSPVSFQTVLARQSETRITFGLQRIHAVYEQLERFVPAMIDYHPRILTVAGTNGKGSTCAFAESLLQAHGQTTGLFTSPHLWCFNERIRVNGIEANDHELDEAMIAIEQAQREALPFLSLSDNEISSLSSVPLSYFELAALLAWILFANHKIAFVILEVGLGGRLDAVNRWNADVSILTTIHLDHQHYLGNTREAIAQEKLAIARSNCPFFCTETDLPDGVEETLKRIGADYHQFERDFGIEKKTSDDSWQLWWYTPKRSMHSCNPSDFSYFHTMDDLPVLSLAGEKQYHNAAVAIRSVQTLLGLEHKTLTLPAVRHGLLNVTLRGRLEIWHNFDCGVTLIFDVAHNPQAAEHLAQYLWQNPLEKQQTLAILGMLEDKDEKGVVFPLYTVVDHWFLTSLLGNRGQSANNLAQKISDQFLSTDMPSFNRSCHNDPTSAFNAAMTIAQQNDRIIVLGSFHTVATCYQTAKMWKTSVNN